MTGRLALILEERFQRLPDGRIISPSGFDDHILGRYLESFDHLLVIARIQPTSRQSETSGSVPISSDRIQFIPIPPYIGVGAMLPRLPIIAAAVFCGLKQVDGAILRAPGIMAMIAAPLLRLLKRPYAVELIGDPMGVFGSGGVGGTAAPLYKLVAVSATRQLCAKARAVSYVTHHTLQAAYPPAESAFTVACSDVALEDSDFFEPDARRPGRPGRATLFAAGSLEQMYKGADTLVAAIEWLTREEGLDLVVRWAGDGRCRAEVANLIENAGLSARFHLLGALNRPAVLEEMRACDIYVQPSRTEGLPRAVIEACAQGAPIIATRVGGIPELVQEEWLSPPAEPKALAFNLARMVRDLEARKRSSAVNRATAESFRASDLSQRRGTFFSTFRSIVNSGQR
ncbi:glycosyltransferase involved in cell wall biosynthesis [Brevundimonas bullata]|uniref:Glycosyltransferase involved in cell wall biosynthesis n=1 Tax=Brevundimonas bullata TaxID=13160 RepID=A0A7W7IQ72_9CAUL|nr:glycosyltransferase family 4 protein [Brevundimonas bullata]MBB4798268.1 glycosyltransferase involved in cell wall biosynthesis [Brevundimonas bullata]MBB6383418.1 glycosyltransferase involved in cell wall biosynthesis [Brevundimonas bullata]